MVQNALEHIIEVEDFDIDEQTIDNFPPLR